MCALLITTGTVSAATYSGGSGTSGDPYLLSTDSDIDTLATTSADWGSYFKLTQDITLVGNHTPIGNLSTQFTGDFDGNGYAVSNLTVYNTGGLAGFFGQTSSANIHDLGVEASSDGVFSTGYHVGVLVGFYDGGNISNCYATGNAIGNGYYVGGLVGRIVSGNVSNCYATGNATASNFYVGGLVGKNSGTVSNCYATGNAVTASNFAGGLVGLSDGTVSNSFATGNATGSSTGGLVGYNDGGSVTTSYYSGTPAAGEGTSTSYINFLSFAFVSGASGLNWNSSNDVITTEVNLNFIWKIDDGYTLPYFQTPAVAPVADFTSNVTSGVISLPVSFTDLSTNSPVGWTWYFGDENLTEDTWIEVNSSSGWSGRNGHSSVVLSDGSIVLMGGNDVSDIRNDTWISTDNGATWTEVNSSSGWSARYSHSSVVLPDNTIVLMGGHDGSYKNDTWVSTDSGTTWTEVNSSSGWPSRYHHSCVALSDGSIVLMGGTGSSRFNDTWVSTDSGATWTEVNSSSGWSARFSHSSVVLPDDSIILTGGRDSGFTNDVWKSNDSGATWVELNSSAGWLVRKEHETAVLPDSSMLLFGGDQDESFMNDVWRSADGGSTWTEVNSSSGWSVRTGQSSAALPNGNILVMGGYTWSGRANDVWSLTTASSIERNPVHTYTQVGTYQVSLQSYNSAGYDNTVRTEYITAYEVPVADFSANITSGEVPLTVGFTDLSTNGPISWFWDFGDGTNSTDQNPTHTYTSAGNYDVSLNVTNAGGSNVSTQLSYITTAVTPVANFSSNVTSGAIPLSLSFTDLSTNSPTSWLWDFGDGNTSTDQNPTYTYTSEGTYTVSLNVSNVGGSNISTQVDYITAIYVATYVNASNTSVTYNENENMMVDPGIVVNGSSTFTSARVYIGDGYVENEDFLRFTNTSRINGSFDSLTGILSLSGSANAAVYQEALRNVRYENIEDDPDTSDRNITFVMGSNSVYLESTDHYYESIYVGETPITWTDAKVAAEERSLSGMQGYLATILTAEESAFLESKAPDNAWMGANDVLVEGEWRWVTGPENVTGEGTLFYFQNNSTTVSGFYSNWNEGEPNDYGSGEDYAQILGADNKMWNDLSNANDVYYYLVEYGGMPNETAPQLTATITVNINSINDAPSMPGNFTNPLANDTVERGSTINVSWGESTDQENDSIVYDLWYFNGTWGQITDMLNVTNYEFTIPIDDISEAVFKVYANDSVVNSTENNVTFNLTSFVPAANFTANVTSGMAPLTVNFTDLSSNRSTSWLWDFGDGNTSTDQNPTHVYVSAGAYNVSLNATNLGGSNVSTQLSYITTAFIPVANFSANVTEGATPLSVNFTDMSLNSPTSWSWDFGDGNTSTDQNPTHIYVSAGTYNVSLNATNLAGSNVSTQISYIATAATPVVNFSANTTEGAVPISVNFTDLSLNSPTEWLWNFGDGNTSTDQNPTHIYSSAGIYNVSLNTTNIGGSNVSTQFSYITVYTTPVADFSANVAEGAAPLTVNFTDMSTYMPTNWTWNFGDGNTSTAQNPTHTYMSAGTYNVSLNATNLAGSNITTMTSCIAAYITPVANFNASITSGTAPLSVTFIDLSNNTPTSWLWDFGDGSNSTSQNPTHSYTTAGSYNVTLNATNAAGSNVSVVTSYINVSVASTDSTDSGSSGTRASVSQGQDPKIVSQSASSVKRVTGGSEVKYDFSGSGTPVIGISFDAKEDKGLVVAKVQVLSGNPDDVPSPSGKSYQTLSIDVGGEGTISSDSAGNVKIHFKVVKEWIEQNNIDISTIRMSRYNSDQWNDLPTYQEREEGEYVYFYAETPGFSIFEVVGDEISEVTEQVPASASIVEEESEPVKEDETSGIPGFTALTGFVFISLATFLRRKD
nr:PKD domain-containing protein [uncultured Methanolobus sp.]